MGTFERGVQNNWLRVDEEKLHSAAKGLVNRFIFQQRTQRVLHRSKRKWVIIWNTSLKVCKRFNRTFQKKTVTFKKGNICMATQKGSGTIKHIFFGRNG